MLFRTSLRGLTILHIHESVLMVDTEVVILDLAAHMADMVDMVGATEVWAHTLGSAVVIQMAMVVTEDTEQE